MFEVEGLADEKGRDTEGSSELLNIWDSSCLEIVTSDLAQSVEEPR